MARHVMPCHIRPLGGEGCAALRCHERETKKLSETNSPVRNNQVGGSCFAPAPTAPAKEMNAQITSTGPTPQAAAAGSNIRLPSRAPNFPRTDETQNRRTAKTTGSSITIGVREASWSDKTRQEGGDGCLGVGFQFWKKQTNLHIDRTPFVNRLTT